ncbi:hypothetical protein BC834DRAFT_79343 [Gloeopeniophorella convolvens]|nr:hypothetical protein BC834DRAFT_79343 [Gloeopeniophorella convolvens]
MTSKRLRVRLSHLACPHRGAAESTRGNRGPTSHATCECTIVCPTREQGLGKATMFFDDGSYHDWLPSYVYVERDHTGLPEVLSSGNLARSLLIDLVLRNLELALQLRLHAIDLWQTLSLINNQTNDPMAQVSLRGDLCAGSSMTCGSIKLVSLIHLHQGTAYCAGAPAK